MRLKELEGNLLEKAWEDLQSEKRRLAETETVKKYLNWQTENEETEEDFY